MGKPIPAEIIDRFRDFCQQSLAEDETEFSTECLEFLKEKDQEGTPLWEFHAANYAPETSHDIYELFRTVADRFVIEQHGYDSFVIVPADQN